MAFTRPAHGDRFNDSSATDGTTVIDALSDAVEAAQATLVTLQAAVTAAQGDITATQGDVTALEAAPPGHHVSHETGGGDEVTGLGGGSGVVPWVDVTDVTYGADKTGSADSTTAIQAAFAAAGNQGWVFFPAGSYKVTDQGSGFCLDISSYSGIHLMGPSSGRSNPSGTGGSATIFTTSTSTIIIKSVSAALNHQGPFVENLRIESRSASANGFSLYDYNNYIFRNVTFRGVGSAGSATSYGLQIDAAHDASYGHIEACSFQRHLTGASMHGSAGASIDGDCYFESNVTSHVLLDLQGGTAFTYIIGNKFEGNSTTGGIGIQCATSGGSQSIIGNGFEGCKTAINMLGPGAGTYTGTTILGNLITGSNATETGIVIGTNRTRDVIGFNRLINLATNITDNGTDTVLFGVRPDGARAGEFMRIGGVFVGEGTAAPSYAAVDGSLYLRSGTGVYHRSGGAWNLISAGTFAAWSRVAATYSTSITPDVTSKSMVGITVTDGTAFTINAPTGGVDGQIIVVSIFNNSGGTIGNVTWSGPSTIWSNSTHKPANGHRTNIMLGLVNTTWYQIASITADLA